MVGERPAGIPESAHTLWARTFQAMESAGRCEICQGFRCPHCHRCGCALLARPITRTACFMPYTPAEMASGNHECF